MDHQTKATKTRTPENDDTGELYSAGSDDDEISGETTNLECRLNGRETSVTTAL